MTIRRLVLVRHAKAEAGEGDGARTLTGRGRRDAAAIGRQLGKWNIAPSRVLISPAVRARQTWEAAATQLRNSPQPQADDHLYENTVEALVAAVQLTGADVETLVLVGHNPSIEDFANELDDGRGDPAARDALADGFSTSGVAVFDIDSEWAAVHVGTGTLTDFAVARG